MPVSLNTRQRLRQILGSIEKADEIIDAISTFVDRFINFNNTFSGISYNTIYEYDVEDNSTVLLTFSVVAKELTSNSRASFKRTSTFYRDNGGAVQTIENTQTDYTNEQLSGFDAKFSISGNKVQLQVKNGNSLSTKWSGSLEVEKLS